jgi:hypothetical protein
MGDPNMTIASTIAALKAASAIVIGFGLSTALAAWPPLNLPSLWLIDLMFLPFDGLQTLSAPEPRILSAILGGVLVGWGVMQWLIAAQLYAREPVLARQIMWASLWSWFAVDCTASAVAGAPFNAVMNLPFLLLFIIPLWRSETK